MKTIIDFKTKEDVSIEKVGGKAKSLIKMTQGSFNVPGGFVLTVDFFKEWLDALMADPFLKENYSDERAFVEISKRLKGQAEVFEISYENKTLIENALKEMADTRLFAVRSSSPEEDLVNASFAGGYETILGVTGNKIYDAIKEAFVSCLDERVFYYKHQNAFDTSELSIAVIIQRQIDSDVSGVGFSLNPLDNNFDEVVINGNFGLGESVVAGRVTPDEFVVDKTTLTVTKKVVGSKKEQIVLLPSGGTECISGMADQVTLTDEAIIELTKVICEIGRFYGFPVDIEWAYKDRQLYILQSRPITTYIPLPESMMTKAGEAKILYLDGSLTKQGVTIPISHMGCQVIELIQDDLFLEIMGKDVLSDPKYGFATTQGGRMYVNLSSAMKMQNQKRVSKAYESADMATAELILNSDLGAYIPKKTSDPMKGVIWNTIKNNMGTLKQTKRAIKDPKSYKEWYQPKEDQFDAYLLNEVNYKGPVMEQSKEIVRRYITLLSDMMVMTYAAEFSRSRLKKILKKNFESGEEKMQFLERSLPDNDTIDMGLKMYDLSQLLEFETYSFVAFETQLKARKLPEAFLKAWDAFMDLYGCRTTVEIDVASPRPYDAPKQIFKQLKMMASLEDDMSPHGIYEKSVAEREETHQMIVKALSGTDKKKYEKHYKSLLLLGGKREGLKYWMIRTVDAIRKMILNKATELYDLKLIDALEDIYWLDFKDLDDYALCGREIIDEKIGANKEYYKKLDQVVNFPKIIDSRGKILTQPPVEVKKGQLVGQAISPGLVRGKVKVLHAPDEKPILPGEILVTKATDPGWTPLFINASAIVLEVGGILQHGALVAREYGKPCIAGIEGVVNLLEDGMEIEVDGTRGIISVVTQNEGN